MLFIGGTEQRWYRGSGVSFVLYIEGWKGFFYARQPPGEPAGDESQLPGEGEPTFRFFQEYGGPGIGKLWMEEGLAFAGRAWLTVMKEPIWADCGNSLDGEYAGEMERRSGNAHSQLTCGSPLAGITFRLEIFSSEKKFIGGRYNG